MASLRSSAESSASKAADMANATPADLASLPAAYRAWRASDLGRITDRIEEELIFALAGPVTGKRVLDVGCGDGVLSVRLAQQGAHVTGVDVDRRMLDAARNRASSAHAAVTCIEGNVELVTVRGGHLRYRAGGYRPMLRSPCRRRRERDGKGAAAGRSPGDR